MPKEFFPNQLRIKLIHRVQFPENATPPLGCTRRSQASSLPFPGRVNSDWRKAMKRCRYQYGSLTKKNNRLSEDVWQFRFYETTHEGHRYRRSITVGTVAQYPTKTDALRIIEPLRLRLNLHHRFGRPVSIGALIDHYIERELPQRRHSTQQSHSSTLKRWILPRWGDRPLEDVRPVAVEEWLRSLTLAPKTKVNLRSLFHLIYEHARRWELTEEIPSTWYDSGAVAVAYRVF